MQLNKELLEDLKASHFNIGSTGTLDPSLLKIFGN